MQLLCRRSALQQFCICSSKAAATGHAAEHLQHCCSQENFNADTYTKQGLEPVQSTTFKNLLLRHYPELEASIGNPLGDNAFYAWTGAPLNGDATAVDEVIATPGACPAAGHSEL